MEIETTQNDDSTERLEHIHNVESLRYSYRITKAMIRLWMKRAEVFPSGLSAGKVTSKLQTS